MSSDGLLNVKNEEKIVNGAKLTQIRRLLNVRNLPLV